MNTTVVMPVSPIKSHPATDILDETINSVRYHLPDNEIILQIDGIRDEQIDWLDNYNEFKDRILWKCLHQWNNVLPIIFDEHSHQSTMMKKTFEYINTPLLLYVESDAPLVINKKIPVDKIENFILSGDANTVRLHHENVIPVEHSHLMIGEIKNFTKTIQWSQRPHFSSVIYYKDIVMADIPDKSFIEDYFHSQVQSDYYEYKQTGWYKHRLWIYTPEGGIKRSYHTDGRAGEKKFTSDDEAGL